jgi:uncharacterized protein YggU (UPF0235/DUF167 family)
VILHLTVKPGSKVDLLYYDAAGKLNAKIKAPAQYGKAITYLVGFLGYQFGLAKSNEVILTGFANPQN